METELPNASHWELAKKYDLMGAAWAAKITGAGFPVYKGKGARLPTRINQFLLDEARADLRKIVTADSVNTASGYGTGQLPDKEGQMYHCK